MSVTYLLALAAKDRVKKLLAGFTWVVGVGITRTGGEYRVKVLSNAAFAGLDIARLVPAVVDGVTVDFEYVGEITALEGA